MAQGLFLGGTGRGSVAHTRPEFPKMPTAPSAFPLLGAPQAPGDKPNLPEGSKSLGGRPPEAVGNPQAPRHTLPEPRPDNSAGQSATQHLERSSLKSICHQNDRDWNICWPPHLTGKYGTRPFFRWDRAQGRSPHAPGVPKNAYGPVGIPLIRGASGAGR